MTTSSFALSVPDDGDVVGIGLLHGKPFTGSDYPLVLSEEPGGEEARLMLLVSDGVQTERAVTPTFTLPSLPPTVQIHRAHRWTGEHVPIDEGHGDGRREGDAMGEFDVANVRNVARPVEEAAGAVVSLGAHGTAELGTDLPDSELRWKVEDESGSSVPVRGSDTGKRFLHRFASPGRYTVELEGTDPRTGLTATDSIEVQVTPPPLPDE